MRLSLSSSHSGACEHVQDLIHPPLEWKHKNIYLPPAVKGQLRFSWQVTVRNYKNLSINHSCGSTPLFWTGSLPLIPKRVPFALPSNFIYPSYFIYGWYNQTGVVVIHFPLPIILCSEPNMERVPDSEYSISVVLQEFMKTCTLLWTLYMRSSPNRYPFANYLSYCCSKRSI